MDTTQNFTENVTVGRIININNQFRNFTVISNNAISSTIRFNISGNTRFFDIFGRPINFNRLRLGMNVQVRHASFMTMSIPPQTTAFVVQVIR